MTRTARLIITGTLALAGLAGGTTSVVAAQPEIEHSGRYTDTFEDDFILELCGIETLTTVTEGWTLTTYADGSQQFRVSRKFVSEDPRLPIEYGAGMSKWDVNGVQTVYGSPIRLQRPDGGVYFLDAGRITLRDDPTFNGPHTFHQMDLADLYCP